MTEIVKTEDVLGGKPRLRNHRISVLDVVEMLETDHTPAEVAESLNITTEEVEAASRYYRTHRREIAEQARNREELYQELLEQDSASAVDADPV
jgi:uncharacterized protein (DUF433 family)